MPAHSVKVSFHNLDEFLAELEAAPPNVEPILRHTGSYHGSSITPGLQKVFILATYLRLAGGVLQLVELQRYLGQQWQTMGDTAANQKTTHTLESCQRQLDDAATRLHLTVRPGTYELPILT
jgi:hypothetical protein